MHDGHFAAELAENAQSKTRAWPSVPVWSQPNQRAFACTHGALFFS